MGKQIIGDPVVINGRRLSLSRAVRAGDFVFLTVTPRAPSPVFCFSYSLVLIQLPLREVHVARKAVVVLCLYAAGMSSRGFRPRDFVRVWIQLGNHGTDVIEALHWDVQTRRAPILTLVRHK